MATKATYIYSRKVLYNQVAIATEANTDAGATWGAGESTLANSLKAKINLILATLRTVKILDTATPAAKKVFSTRGFKSIILQTAVADEATADSDATYGAPEQDLLNSMKGKVNSILAALRSVQVLDGRVRYLFPWGRKAVTTVTVADIALTADGTYTSGASGEQQLTNDIKARINSILVALRAAKIILP